MVAVKAGRQATFADAGVAVLDRVDLLGIPTAGAHLSGGSGLGSGNEVSAQALATLLVLAASPQHPELRALLSGLPVAGASGTLADRFATGRERSGLGVVRAKTGTLTGASSLSGTVVDADGRQLGFVILADRVTSTLAARAALDDAASALAACGCR
jgi:D-alanyl-D-alanine carboxypeptidase/D-alanyl-D-alanine-endopeptidase (penicillin-binding protein 4)